MSDHWYTEGTWVRPSNNESWEQIQSEVDITTLDAFNNGHIAFIVDSVDLTDMVFPYRIAIKGLSPIIPEWAESLIGTTFWCNEDSIERTNQSPFVGVLQSTNYHLVDVVGL